jgi:hypothetical protein
MAFAPVVAMTRTKTEEGRMPRRTLVSPAAAQSPLADHGDDLAPAETQRERDRSSRSERVGNNTPVANPLTSPLADAEGERPAA